MKIITSELGYLIQDDLLEKFFAELLLPFNCSTNEETIVNCLIDILVTIIIPEMCKKRRKKSLLSTSKERRNDIELKIKSGEYLKEKINLNNENIDIFHHNEYIFYYFLYIFFKRSLKYAAKTAKKLLKCYNNNIPTFKQDIDYLTYDYELRNKL